MIECGTYAGYQRHKYRDEDACAPCKAASAEASKNWREANRERARELDANRAPGRHLKLSPESKRSTHLRTRYGITLANWNEIFEWQDRACACCGSNKSHDREKPWQVDHDHETGVVRGILCSRCNRLVGQSEDNAYGVAVTMTRLLTYLSASGDVLDDDQVEQIVLALRSRVALRGVGVVHEDRPPIPRHAEGSR